MKWLSILFVGSIIILLGMQVWQFFGHFGKLQVIFCDVGQGDAILLHSPGGKSVLIDGGPDQSILNCLSDHLGMFTHTIDAVVLTHPHSDHYEGLRFVLNSYHVKQFITEPLGNQTPGFARFVTELKDKQISTHLVHAGSVLHLDAQVTLTIIGPSDKYLAETSPTGMLTNSKEFSSIISEVSFGKFHGLFTGDSQVAGMVDSLPRIRLPIVVMQVPHHGSQYGLDSTVLAALKPAMSVISVGAHNRFGHPAPHTLSLYKDTPHLPYLRTDQNGSVVITTDGKTWQVTPQHK